jgi:hypothetical protein
MLHFTILALAKCVRVLSAIPAANAGLPPRCISPGRAADASNVNHPNATGAGEPPELRTQASESPYEQARPSTFRTLASDPRAHTKGSA